MANKQRRLQNSIPTGLAFELSDLVILQGWAEYHDLRMVIELDYWADGEEYEEVVALYPHNSSFRRWMIWRDLNGVVVQPIVGRSTRSGSVCEALETPELLRFCPP